MRDDFVALNDVVKVFGSGEGEVLAVDNVNLRVRESELITLLGPSGCGKTTTLRMIAGFEFPTSGDILVDGQRINDVPPNRRPTSIVFQNYALFPHMTVAENISYGLRIGKEENSWIRQRTEEVMRLVGLSGLADRSTAQLSGGQQQRVSLARSLIMEPKVLLLDEPLSNLDAKLRVATRLEIRRLQQRLGITSVYVTHDQEEAMVLSDRIVVMNDGRIQQIGSPEEIYARPANRFVADFVGQVNFVESTVSRAIDQDEVEASLFGQPTVMTAVRRSYSEGERVLITIRPESVQIGPPRKYSLHGEVKEAVYLGNQMSYRVSVDGTELVATVMDPQMRTTFTAGDPISVGFMQESLHVLPFERRKEEAGAAVQVAD